MVRLHEVTSDRMESNLTINKTWNVDVKPEPTEILKHENLEFTDVKCFAKPDTLEIANVHTFQETAHKCNVCSKTFKSRKSLTRHMKSHTTERNYKCATCSKSFKTRVGMVQHMTFHSVERNHKCEICSKRFKIKATLLKHMNSHTDNRNHRCEICDSSFKWRQNLLQHMKVHAQETSHKCEICFKSFKWRQNMLKHMRMHVGEANFREIANEHSAQQIEEFQERSGEEEFSVVVKQEDFECSVYDKMKINFTMQKKDPSCSIGEVKPEPTELFNLEHTSSRYSSNMTENSIDELPQENFVVVKEENHLSSLPTSFTLDHLKTECKIGETSDDAETKFDPGDLKICNDQQIDNNETECLNDSLLAKRNLEAFTKHFKLRNENCHKCDTCFRSFKRRSNMLAHMKLHTNEFGHECKICRKSFTLKVALLGHMKSHGDPENLQCEICSKSFKTRRYLLMHMQTHTDERNYKCEICAKRFKTRKIMSRHVSVHIDERNHKCGICCKCFKVRSSMLRHMKTHNIHGLD